MKALIIDSNRGLWHNAGVGVPLPQKGKVGKMTATTNTKLQAYFDEYCERMQRRITALQKQPVVLETHTKNRPHVLKRFEETAAMSREELIQEIEADCFLFVGCCVVAEQYPLGSQKYLDEYCKQMLKSIATFQEDPTYLEDKMFLENKGGDERAHILQRYNKVAAMSREELMQDIEADYLLFHGTAPGGVPID